MTKRLHMVVTTLMDNTALEDKGMVAEHGFSCLVELPQAMVLLDTGATGIFVRNARTLGKDLSQLDHIVISHGHFDHGGGLRTLLEEYHPSMDTSDERTEWVLHALASQGIGTIGGLPRHRPKCRAKAQLHGVGF